MYDVCMVYVLMGIIESVLHGEVVSMALSIELRHTGANCIFSTQKSR